MSYAMLKITTTGVAIDPRGYPCHGLVSAEGLEIIDDREAARERAHASGRRAVEVIPSRSGDPRGTLRLGQIAQHGQEADSLTARRAAAGMQRWMEEQAGRDAKASPGELAMYGA